MDIEDLTGGWDYSKLPSNLRFGRDCYFEVPGIFANFRSNRNPGLMIGDRVKVYHWAALSTDENGYLEIGDDSILAGPIFWCGEKIIVGRRVTISYNVMIADGDFHPKDPVLRQADAIAVSPFGNRSERPVLSYEPVIIEDDVAIGMGAIILKGVRIGRGATVGPGAVVSRSVPAGVTIAGNPARIVEQARLNE